MADLKLAKKTNKMTKIDFFKIYSVLSVCSIFCSIFFCSMELDLFVSWGLTSKLEVADLIPVHVTSRAHNTLCKNNTESPFECDTLRSAQGPHKSRDSGVIGGRHQNSTIKLPSGYLVSEVIPHITLE